MANRDYDCGGLSPYIKFKCKTVSEKMRKKLYFYDYNQIFLDFSLMWRIFIVRILRAREFGIKLMSTFGKVSYLRVAE